MSNQCTFLDTYLALRASSEAERKQRAKEREALLSTIAVVEAELVKPEYFGYLVEKDRVGYLEALSKTKTTFRGLNPHDPLNGMVVNGELNPDFMLMLEKNFFKVNSENLSVDELNFVRYETERNKMIEWLRGEFQRLAIDDEYLKQEAGITQEELFQGLLTNSLLFATKIDDEKTYIVDTSSYLEGVENGCYCGAISQKFIQSKKSETFQFDLFGIINKKQQEVEMEKREIQKKWDMEIKNGISTTIGIVVAFIFFAIIFVVYQQVFS